jgi:hypothetical protein
MEDIAKIIIEKNREVGNIPYGRKFSVSAIIGDLKKEFDKEGQAKRCSERDKDNPDGKYYGMSPNDILRMWEENSARSKKMGIIVDDYVAIKTETPEDKREAAEKMFKMDHEWNAAVKRKLEGIDEVFDRFKREGPMQFICRELPLYIPMSAPGTLDTYYVSGRFDALFFYKDRFVLIDWKNSENIESSNKYEEKMFGPLSEMDACDHNSYTTQLYLYVYALRNVYGIKTPISPGIVQFPAEKEYKHRILTPNYPYSDELITNVIQYGIQKELLKRQLK